MALSGNRVPHSNPELMIIFPRFPFLYWKIAIKMERGVIPPTFSDTTHHTQIKLDIHS
jgi:hypothetical protein